jgi:hypothetical protein
MTLPDSPNRSTPLSLRYGDSGWPVYGLQGGLGALGYMLAQDGTFGDGTDKAVRRFQSERHLAVDGIAGSTTQGILVHELDILVHNRHLEVPAGMLRGFVATESGGNVGATNWSVPGGVDCGVVQIRVLGPPYDADVFLQRRDTLGRLPTARARGAEFTDRCAALAWNWPFAADQYARNGGLPDPGRIADWVPAGALFPDGAHVRTWKDWAEFYAIGGRHGDGRVTRFVTSW